MPPAARPLLVLLIGTALSGVLIGLFAVVGHETPDVAVEVAEADVRSPVDPALLRELRRGGFVLLMRHARTDSSVNDADPTSLGGCDEQRPLSEEGRMQARHVGVRLASLSIPIGTVLASPFCRTLETAELVAQAAGAAPARVAEGLTSTRTATNADESRDIIFRTLGLIRDNLAGPDNVILVSHEENIDTVTDERLEEGAIVVLEQGRGDYRVATVVGSNGW